MQRQVDAPTILHSYFLTAKCRHPRIIIVADLSAVPCSSALPVPKGVVLVLVGDRTQQTAAT